MATTYKDYYATLGVPKAAPQKEIKAAFRKLARQYHPDVNKSAGALERFKEINEANEVLGDPEKRTVYDDVGPQWEAYQTWDKAGRPGGGNPFAGGRNPFAAAASGRGRPGGAQVEYRTVSPDDLEGMFGGAENPFSDFFHDLFGRGRTAFNTASGKSTAAATTAPRTLRGSDVEGELTITLDEAFTGCTRTVELTGGNGRPRRLEVRIPAGIADGGRIRVGGQGGTGPMGGTSGDLVIRVQIAPHPLFTREGDAVRTRIPVPLATALLGGEVDVPTPKGNRVSLRIPAETQNGSRLRLRGQGMPHLQGNGRGDLIAEVDIRLPLPLDDAGRAAGEALRR